MSGGAKTAQTMPECFRCTDVPRVQFCCDSHRRAVEAWLADIRTQGRTEGWQGALNERHRLRATNEDLAKRNTELEIQITQAHNAAIEAAIQAYYDCPEGVDPDAAIRKLKREP